MENILNMFAINFEWPIVVLIINVVTSTFIINAMYNFFLDREFAKHYKYWLIRNTFLIFLKTIHNIALFICTYYTRPKNLDTVY